jgi:uncharacterized protein (TIGR00290 family)
MGRSSGRQPAILFWSSGKDAAFALHEVRRRGELEVVALVTTVNRDEGAADTPRRNAPRAGRSAGRGDAAPSAGGDAGGRVAVHGVRRELLDRQAAALGLPLVAVELPSPCPNEVYEREVAAALAPLRERGVEDAVFGDLFLEDVRAYREEQMAAVGVTPVFPLWGRDTAELAREMLAAGVDARLVCVDTEQLDAGFAGRRFDAALLGDLPAGCDPCGENGEFHTFVASAPGFQWPIPIERGPMMVDGRFAHADLLPSAISRDLRGTARAHPAEP